MMLLGSSARPGRKFMSRACANCARGSIPKYSVFVLLLSQKEE